MNEVDYVELGLACASVWNTLDQGLIGKLLTEINGSVCEAIKRFAMGHQRCVV